MMEFEYILGSITEFRDSFSTRANWQTWEEQDPYPRKLASQVEFIPQFIVAGSPFNFSKKLLRKLLVRTSSPRRRRMGFEIFPSRIRLAKKYLVLEAEILLRSKGTFVLECKKKKRKKEKQSIRFPSPRGPLCKGCARSMEGKIERPNQFRNRDQEIHLENSSLSWNRFRSVELHFLPFPFAAMRRRKRKGKGVYRGGRGSRLARVNSDTSGCYAVSAHLKWKCALRFSSLAGSSRLAPPFCFITRCDTSPWRHLGFHILFHSLIPSSTTPSRLIYPDAHRRIHGLAPLLRNPPPCRRWKGGNFSDVKSIALLPRVEKEKEKWRRRRRRIVEGIRKVRESRWPR